jgi:pimeloyl-ACP methyl ester carboxylesterase
MESERGPTSLSIARPGGSISALDWGGPPPVLLMLHASGLCAGAFDPLARRLTEACRPVAIDLRGHGASTAPRERADSGYAALASDVFAALDALGIESAVGLGNSLGGGVLLRAAIERPGFFSGLILCEAAATSIDAEMLERRVRRLGEAARKRRTVFAAPSDLVERYAGKRPFDLFPRESLEAHARWGLMVRGDGRYELSCSPETEVLYNTTSLSEIGAGEIEDRLSEIPAAGTRCILVRGRRSPFPEESHQKQIEPLQAEVVQVDGGHFLPQEDPDATAKMVRERLLGVGPSSR